ncbi:MAG: ABC transporter ATP-binding protein [Anaeromicrobium sp.]|jgi:iron complex transport system ATP-binding protein|uniref:ABC transporter ATP-binding protein n=1 Tax=Anaeromicrobium sp. TaxID=1929132 RepID=UPI0025E25D01|nr:ABC transporter ATP-binding protein [Anaeromicrobium sp.]MCT4595663.1 ABC transporter ATP-binding protein [Anaeromicrobium sp.]
MFQVKNLSFSYGDKETLKNLTFKLEEGTMTTIIGPNGSGKTTLLNVITNNLDNYSGHVYLGNKNLKDYSIKELSQNLAIVYQNVDIKFPFTCMEVVAMGRTPFSSRMKDLTKKDLEIIYEVMDMTDTTSFMKKDITQLSGGEKQRIMLARALAQRPKILVLDEAFSNMDIKYTIKFLDLLREKVKNDGITVINIMHDLNLTDIYSDNILALSKGNLVKSGKTEDIMNPQFIKSLFGINTRKISDRGLAILPM